MADIWSRAKRSEVMSRIRGRNTKPEKQVRSLLHRMGYPFYGEWSSQQGLAREAGCCIAEV